MISKWKTIRKCKRSRALPVCICIHEGVGFSWPLLVGRPSTNHCCYNNPSWVWGKWTVVMLKSPFLITQEHKCPERKHLRLKVFKKKNNITNPKDRNNFVRIWCFSALPWQNPLHAQDYGHSFPGAPLVNTVFAHSQADVKCLCQASQLLGKQAVWHFRKASSVNPGTPSYSFLSKWKLAPNLSPSCTQAVHSLCLQCFALAPTKSSGAEHPQLPLADMELCLPTNPSK